jgi:hypothetical protein
VGVCQGILNNFSVHYFIEGHKVIDPANRCARARSAALSSLGLGGAVWFQNIFNIIFYILLFLLYELEEIKPMRRPSVVTVSHSLRSF